MKKRITASVVCAAMLFMFIACFAGCSAKDQPAEQSKYLGSWTAKKVKLAGSDTLQPIEDFSDGKFSAEFKSDGTCEYTINNTTWKYTGWEETEDGFKVVDSRGTIYATDNDDGTFSVKFSEGGVDCELIFEKD